ncbi:lytic polysaccharide monooxygenase [Kribbella sp. NPDC056861]|uniref:lytic polysaccharide monooxygenase n=1 Tax=Kribbella sp. NPDC056861 TaxID=3154857 RepID=UPI0034196D1E
MKHRAKAITVMLAATAGLLTAGTPAFAHGFADSPTSRATFCQQGHAGDCGQIRYEPQSVEAAKGFPAAGPADGQICSGGHPQFAALDDPRNGLWPATKVEPGSFGVGWHMTAQHRSTKIEYFITKDGWDPNRPLQRSALELLPFHTADLGGNQPPAKWTDTVNLPRRNGRHLILSIWTIADTANAFYQCADVIFGDKRPSTGEPLTVPKNDQEGTQYGTLTQSSGATVGTPLRGGQGKCLDVAGSNSADGAVVQLFDCNQTAAQQWQAPGDGSVHALGKCLDARYSGRKNGTRVQLWTCNGTGAQKWHFTQSGDLVNDPADKCLDVIDKKTANWTPTQLWDCAGSANQKWQQQH